MVSKRKFKIISIIASLFVILTLISLKSLKVKANNVNTKPSFTITDLKATPNPAKVGEDILVSGKIVPEDFETTAQPKEIVLVLDTSGSMSKEIGMLCTNERERYYCTEHKSNDSNHKGNKHKVVENYCVEHKTNQSHNTTRINELKKAAKSFIETMKDVSNLKISIVAYSTEATFNPNKNLGKKIIDSYDFGKHEVINYEQYSQDFLPNNDSKLNDIIECLEPLGGTNTGEGIRKAIYMLENGEKNSNKTIVLMTDGLPTFYSVEDTNKKEYTKIDASNPKTAGLGSGVDNNSLNYSKKIGTIVNSNIYNSYSIGYGLDSNSAEYFKQIHTTMRGLTSTKEATEKNGFFSKSNGSITEIFNQIAKDIKNSYELKEVSLDINLNQSFNLNIVGNKVKIDNIVYTKDDNQSSKEKSIYHAAPIDFSFIVKGNNVGENQKIFDKIKVNYLFENEIENSDADGDINVDIISNELPNIAAELKGGHDLEIKKDQEITIEYEIVPQDFIYNNSSNSGDIDVVVIIELGRNQENLVNIKNGIKNKLTDPFQTQKNAKFSFITFNNNETTKVSSLKSFDDSTNYYHDIRLTVDGLQEGNIFESSKKDISGALTNAYEELERNSRPTATKNIVIISNNDINYNKQVADNIKKKGYNIASLSLETENLNKNLYKLHSDLGGKSDSIFNINNDYNSINNSRMDLVREKLISYASAKPYEFKPIINLNLGSNFEPISGIARSKEPGKENIGIIEVPTITYNLTENNNYRAERKTIEFIVKANNLNPGNYTFGKQSDNIMTYKSIINNDIKVNLETPKFTVKEDVKNLIHGLYNGIDDGKLIIQENNNGDNFEIAQDSRVTFGSKFTLGGSSATFDLNVDSNFNVVDTNNIKIYRILKDSSGNNTLTEIARTIESNGNNKFKININNVKENNQLSDTDILVIYQGRVKEDLGSSQVLKNEIKFSNISKDVIIVTPKSTDASPRLPDLF